MRTVSRWLVLALLAVSPALVHAHEAHEAEESHEAVSENTGEQQTLTGEVVDVVCYLSHPAQGLGKAHAGCAKKCILNGLPVALKIGDELYLAAMASHDPANKTLAEFAGERVTVHGQVMERDGQHLVTISSVEKAQ